MEWKPEYSIGIAEIDEHHREILRNITLIEGMIGKHRWSDVHFALLQAKDYMSYHFSVEESLMQILDFADVDAHIVEHKKVLKQMNSLTISILSGSSDQADLVALVRSWFYDHLENFDRQLAQFIVGRYQETKSPHT